MMTTHNLTTLTTRTPMARRNTKTDDTSTPDTPAPFDVVPDAGDTTSTDDDSDGDLDALDNVSLSAGAPPLGIQPVYLSNPKLVPTKAGDRIILEFTLEDAAFEGHDDLQVWINPTDRKDISRAKQIVTALGGSWDHRLNRPAGGWKTVRGARGRAIVDWYAAKDEFQIAKFPPMFRDNTDTEPYREAFIAACAAHGVAVEFVEITGKSKYAGDHVRAKSTPDVFNGCGILPVAE